MLTFTVSSRKAEEGKKNKQTNTEGVFKLLTALSRNRVSPVR